MSTHCSGISSWPGETQSQGTMPLAALFATKILGCVPRDFQKTEFLSEAVEVTITREVPVCLCKHGRRRTEIFSDGGLIVETVSEKDLAPPWLKTFENSVYHTKS